MGRALLVGSGVVAAAALAAAGAGACNALSGVDEYDFEPGRCATALDCPVASPECEIAECRAGRCVTSFSPYGTVLPGQPAGGCTTEICDGAGGVITLISAPETQCNENGVTCQCDGAGACDVHCSVSGCDYSGECGDGTTGCTACALGAGCADPIAECQASQACVDFINCVLPCMDPACIDACRTQFPDGAMLYDELFLCLVCEECPVDCAVATSICP